MLVVARAAQGISGALMAATSLAIITSSFAAGPARHRAIALWGAMNGAGGAAGTVLGGVITQELSWRWVLLINPPIGIAAALVAHRVVTERRKDEHNPRFDLAGALTLTLGQLVLIYGIVTGGEHGWTSPYAILPMVAGAGLLALFGVVEQRAAAPLVPLRQITGSLRVANVIVVLFSAALFPMWYVSSLYLQQVLGLSPLVTGFAFLPMALDHLSVRLARRQARGPLRGAGRPRQWPRDHGQRHVACSLGSAPSGSAVGYIVLPGILTAIGIGLVHRALDDLRHPGSGACSGRARFGPGQHFAPGRWWPGPGLVDLARHGYTSGAIGRNVAVPVALTNGFRLAYLIAAGLVVAAAVVTFAFVKAPGRRARRSALDGLWAASCSSSRASPASRCRRPEPAAPIGAYTTNGAYTFVSAPGLHPPKVRRQHGHRLPASWPPGTSCWPTSTT